MAPFSVFKANNTAFFCSFFCCHTSLWFSYLMPHLHFSGLSNYTEPCIIRDNLAILRSVIGDIKFICNLSSPLPCNLIYSQIPGIRKWTTLREGINLPITKMGKCYNSGFFPRRAGCETFTSTSLLLCQLMPGWLGKKHLEKGNKSSNWINPFW